MGRDDLLRALVRASGHESIDELDEASARQLHTMSTWGPAAVEALVLAMAPGSSCQRLREGLDSPSSPLRSPHAAR